MINVGVIGLGKMGETRIRATEHSQRGNIVAVHDPYVKHSRLPQKNEWIEIVEDPSIDAVFICTPNYLNKEITIAALRNGKHVFCEKPPALTSADITEIRKVEKESNKKLMYGFNHRHHGSIDQMKSLIDTKEYGKILWMRGRYGKSVDESFYNNWRASKEQCGGGILMDQGIHMLDLFLYFAESFDEVKAFVSNLYWNLDIEDNVFAILKNSQTGVVASIHSSMTQWRHLFALEVFLERGYMVLNGLKTSSNSYGPEELTIAKNRSSAPAATWSDEEKFIFPVDESWESEIKEFFDCIDGNLPVKRGNSESAYQLMKLIEDIYNDGKGI